MGVTLTSSGCSKYDNAVPEGAINGKFSVSATKQVYFSKGNLRYASSAWSFFDNQYDYYTSYSEDAWDKFGWSTSTSAYGMNTSTAYSDYSGDFVDWGSNSDLQTALGTGWFTLSSAEWTYLFNTRSASTVGGLTYSDAITVSGDVTLVLTDGETLTLNKGISIADGATLTIQGNGTMNVNGTSGSTASTVADGTGTLVLTSGTLTAKGGDGQGFSSYVFDKNGAAGGVAINGNVTVEGGTLTATGGNGGSISSNAGADNNGGNGGAAISLALTINGGTVTTTDGSNGTNSTEAAAENSAGSGGKAVAGTVTDNR